MSEKKRNFQKKKNFKGKRTRFEIPFNVLCLNCKKEIPQGRRFNAKRTQSGSISTFAVKCFFCEFYFYIRTDPEEGCYKIDRGCLRVEEDSCTLWKETRDGDLHLKKDGDLYLKKDGDLYFKKDGDLYLNDSEENLEELMDSAFLRASTDVDTILKAIKEKKTIQEINREEFLKKL